MKDIVLTGACLLSLSLAGCGEAGDADGDPREEQTTPVSYRVLDPEAEAVRAAFIEDTGKVRAIFLVSPT